MANKKSDVGSTEVGTTEDIILAKPVVSGTADFSWAVNTVKLNRAKAWVNANSETPLKGKELEAAVKERYIDTKGLLVSEKVARGTKTNAVVQNMADDDGSTD